MMGPYISTLPFPEMTRIGRLFKRHFMKKFSSLFMPLGMALLASLAPLAFADEAPEEVKPAPTAPVQGPLHPEWFKSNYDEVRDMTFIQTKDELGTGDRVDCQPDDAVKFGLVGAFTGKTFGPDSRFTAMLFFFRMAGTKYDSDYGLFKGHDKDWRPFDSRSLLVFGPETTVYFLTPSGDRFQCDGDAISHENKTSTGMMSEIYLWEVLQVSMDWDHLKKLTEGAKVAVGDRTLVLGPDQISTINTLIANINESKP